MVGTPARIAFMGAGNIAGPYAKGLAAREDVALIGVFDLDARKRDVFAAEHGCAGYASLDELDADLPDVVVNLTSVPFHYATTKDLIARGHSVFSEKPLAMTSSEARELVDLAKDAGVALGCAPSVWLNNSSLDAARRLRAGAIGKVRYITADMNGGRIERWHPAPHVFYEVGPAFDVGVYPLMYVTAVLGPIVQVESIAATLLPERTLQNGETLRVESPDTYIVGCRFADGALLRLSTNFFLDGDTVARAIDFHGADGSLRLEDWIRGDSPISVADFGKPFEVLVPGDDKTPADFSLGVADLVHAMRTGRQSMVDAEHAAHIVDVLEAIKESTDTHAPVAVSSSFRSPFDEVFA